MFKHSKVRQDVHIQFYDGLTCRSTASLQRTHSIPHTSHKGESHCSNRAWGEGSVFEDTTVGLAHASQNRNTIA